MWRGLNRPVREGMDDISYVKVHLKTRNGNTGKYMCKLASKEVTVKLQQLLANISPVIYSHACLNCRNDKKCLLKAGVCFVFVCNERHFWEMKCWPLKTDD